MCSGQFTESNLFARVNFLFLINIEIKLKCYWTQSFSQTRAKRLYRVLFLRWLYRDGQKLVYTCDFVRLFLYYYLVIVLFTVLLLTVYYTVFLLYSFAHPVYLFATCFAGKWFIFTDVVLWNCLTREYGIHFQSIWNHILIYVFATGSKFQKNLQNIKISGYQKNLRERVDQTTRIRTKMPSKLINLYLPLK